MVVFLFFSFLFFYLYVSIVLLFGSVGGRRRERGRVILSGRKDTFEFYEFGTSFYATTVYYTMNSRSSRV